MLRNNIKSAIAHTRMMLRHRIAVLWQYVYTTQYWLGQWGLRYRNIAFFAVLLLLVSSSVYLSPTLQAILETHYATEQSIQGLRSLILNTGSALIGAAAIVTSLVLFAMQINIERMPHGLFRRLSADIKLLSAFTLAFLLAIGISTLSIFVDQARLAHTMLAASWAVVFILLSFMYAYRRALVLINPLQQLDILIHDTRKGFQLWSQRAQRMTPLLERKADSSATPPTPNSTHDFARTAFFQINKEWTNGPKQSIRHAMSFARRYAEQGDYEISSSALNSIIRINAAYIEAKGKTFYANSAFVEISLSSDGFINGTLEHLRQNLQRGIARKDEQHIEQSLQTIAALIQVYLCIDYSSPHATKSHAHLAAVYLANAVEDVVPHNMADVLLEGLRLMGSSAQLILIQDGPNEIVTLADKIALIACAGCVKETYRPVAMEGMTQLSNLTFELLRSKNHDIRFAAGQVRQNVTLVAKQFLNVPDTTFSNTHSSFLAPYYSSTSMHSLRVRLTAIVNAISEAQEDNGDAQSAIQNIVQWSDGLYKTEKELLLDSIKAKSHFTFDIIHWITGMMEILLAVSNAPACDHYNQEKLQKQARWLIATLTWIPDDKESVSFVENYQVTETLFESALDAHNRGNDGISKEIGDILLSWTFKAGRYQTGRDTLERGLCGIAAFTLKGKDEQARELKTAIATWRSGNTAPSKEICDRAASGILQRIANLSRYGHQSSRIDMEIAQTDHQKLRPLLEEIANLLSPESR